MKSIEVVTNAETVSATFSRSELTTQDRTLVSSQRQVEPRPSTSYLSKPDSSTNLEAEEEHSNLELTPDMRELQKLKNELDEAKRALSKYITAAKHKTLPSESEDETPTKKPHSSSHDVQRDSSKVSTFSIYGMLKPPRHFDGVGDFNKWFSDASRYINDIATDESNKAVILDRLMKGNAASLLESANSLGNMTFTEMKAYLSATFSPNDDVFETVRQTIQKPGETPFAFKLRLEYALSKKHAAIGCVNRAAQERELLSTFKYQTLPAVQVRLASALVKTIDDAITVASQLTQDPAATF
jgi:hypothetical protein